MTQTERRKVREYVMARYEHRNGRNVRIGSDGAVTILIDGDGSQMTHGRDDSGGRIFAGWDTELLAEVSR